MRTLSFENPTVRFGPVLLKAKPHGAERFASVTPQRTALHRKKKKHREKLWFLGSIILRAKDHSHVAHMDPKHVQQ